MSLDIRDYFFTLTEKLTNELATNENIEASLVGEKSFFTRFNQSRIRQISEASQNALTLQLSTAKNAMSTTMSLSTDLTTDLATAHDVLKKMRQSLEQLPEDPYLVPPEAYAPQNEKHQGEIPDPKGIWSTVCNTTKGQDLAGLLVAGETYRGFANSLGTQSWFTSTSSYLDYSLFSAKQKAVKGNYTSSHWNNEELQNSLQKDIEHLSHLQQSATRIEPGKYRCYLAPAAVHELIHLFQWQGLSESAIRQGQSGFISARLGSKLFSPKILIQEDYRLGLGPRFNEHGEPSPEIVTLVAESKLQNSLINRRTAKEFGLVSNGADALESIRSIHIHGGKLQNDAILQALGTGLFISNLHYTNWSDLQLGRITGLTRYACFWVENGKIAAPFETMRFDETIYNILGEKLEDLTTETRLFASTETYEQRSLGGSRIPGVLLSSFSLTL